MNAVAFVLDVGRGEHRKRKSRAHLVRREGFFDSLAGAVRYMRYARRRSD